VSLPSSMDWKTRNCSSRGNRPIRILDVYQDTLRERS
jgi:hypothetical protein